MSEEDTSHQGTPLAEMLDAEGRLNLPPGFSGSLDVRGWDLASGAREAPRFVPEVAGDEKWVAGFGPNGVNGIVYALVADGSGNIYVGGYFGAAGGVAANNIAKWNGTSWSALGYGLDHGVTALAWDGTNHVLYAGGDFTYLCASADCYSKSLRVNSVARWNGTVWWPLGSGMNSNVGALALDGSGNVYAGGNFSGTCTTPACGNANPANHIAKWSPGGWFGSWSALGSGTNVGVDGYVAALAWDGTNDVLYVGGGFTHVANTSISANYVALFNPTGSIWAPLSFGGKYGVNGFVETLVWDGGNDWLYVGGEFDHWCESAACSSPVAQVNYLARWDTAGTLGWLPVGNGVNYIVMNLAVAGSQVYVGGIFDGWCNESACTSTTPAHRIAKWTSSGPGGTGPGTWSTLGSGIGYRQVNALALSGSNVYAGGEYILAGGQFATGIAKWTAASANWSALASGNGASYAVSAVLADGKGNIYVSGSFVGVGHAAANGIAKWNGSNWSALGYGLPGTVFSLALDPSGNLYAGGDFPKLCGNADCSTYGLQVNGVAKWTPSGSSGSWSAVGSGVWPAVRTLTFDPAGKLYAGGHFVQRCVDAACSSTTPARRVARWDGSTWAAVGKGLDNAVFALAVGKNNVLYAGGDFIHLCGDLATCSPSTQVNYVAQWDGNAWSGLGNGLQHSVDALALDKNGALYAGGFFSHVCATAGCALGDQVNHVARWSGSSWSGVGGGMDGPVLALVFDNSNHLFAGGSFAGLCSSASCILVAPADNVAEWNGSSWSALGSGIGPGPSAAVNGLAIQFGSLYAGGSFSTAGDKVSANFAQYRYGKFSYLPLVTR